MSDQRAKEKKALTFRDLRPESVAVEFRYPLAFLFWDFAGQIWREIEESLPEKSLVIGGANPGSVTGTYAEKIEIAIETQRFAVSTAHPKTDFSEFLEILSSIYSAVLKHLKIEMFDRIGLRIIHVKEFKSMEDVAIALQLLPSISMNHKIIDDNAEKQVVPGLTLRIEDKNRGTFFKLHGLNRTFDIGIPPLFLEKDEERLHYTRTQFLLALDVDSYTKTPISASQFSIGDWVKQGHEAIKRDGAKFF